jgi:hypothetical protein
VIKKQAMSGFFRDMSMDLKMEASGSWRPCPSESLRDTTDQIVTAGSHQGSGDQEPERVFVPVSG